MQNALKRVAITTQFRTVFIQSETLTQSRLNSLVHLNIRESFVQLETVAIVRKLF